MPQVTFDRWIDRFTARLRLGDFLRRAAETGAGFLFLFGTLVLIVKLLVPQAWPHVLWLGLGLIPALAAAWWMARRAHRQRWESVARLDAALNTGGLLMTLSERPDTDWAARLPQLELLWRNAIPRIRPRRFAGYLILPLLFAAGACFVPLREASTATVLKNSAARQATQELEELLDSLKEEAVIEKEEQEKLAEEIEKLAEETRDSPLTHEKWETVDALREKMKVRLETASATTSAARDAAAMLSEAGREAGPELSPERLAALEEDLSDALQKMMQKGAFSGAPKDLQDMLRQAMKSGKCQLPGDAGERQEMLDQLSKFLEKEDQKLSDLRKKCSGCKSGQCDQEGDCENGQCEGNRSGESNSNRPGRGGVTRGRGDAELTWGDESDKQGTKFKEVVLPKGYLDQPKDDVVGIQRNAPEDESVAAGPRSAARALDPATGQTTWNRKLNPRHRNAVQKYFGKKDSATK